MLQKASVTKQPAPVDRSQNQRPYLFGERDSIDRVAHGCLGQASLLTSSHGYGSILHSISKTGKKNVKSESIGGVVLFNSSDGRV